MSKLRSAFAAGSAFAAFFTCGDPDLETTAAAIRAAVDSGADLIELGIPFSDPTAEGPAIQASNLRALKAGITTDRVFEFVGALRHDVAVPVVLVTYANVVFSYGAERFLAACREREWTACSFWTCPLRRRTSSGPSAANAAWISFR